MKKQPVTHDEDKVGTPNYVRPPLNWDQAVRVARARMSEQYARPETANDQRLNDAVTSLAAEVSAYEKLGEEVDRLEARPEEPVATVRRKRGSSGVMPATVRRRPVKKAAD